MIAGYTITLSRLAPGCTSSESRPMELYNLTGRVVTTNRLSVRTISHVVDTSERYYTWYLGGFSKQGEGMAWLYSLSDSPNLGETQVFRL